MAEFIHTADWHLGNSFNHFSQDMRGKLQQAIFSSVESIFIYTRKHSIPLIICAGDAIDNGQFADKSLLFQLFELIRKYPEIRLIMITGNHDPLLSNSIYTRVDFSNYPENLTLIQQDTILPIPGLNLNILASSIKEKKGNYNILNWIQPNDLNPEMINIGIAHGSCKINNKYDPESFPIDPDFAMQKKLDYLALGDWHSFLKINDYTYYPGVPEPLQFKDTGYPLRVKIPKPGDIPEVEPITGINQFQWNQLEFQLSDTNYPEFEPQFKNIGLKEIRNLTISGFLSPNHYKNYLDLIGMYQSKYYQIQDQVLIYPSEKELLNTKDSYLKELLEQLVHLRNSKNILMKDISNGVVPISNQELIQTIESINPNEIVNRALIRVYELTRILGN